MKAIWALFSVMMTLSICPVWAQTWEQTNGPYGGLMANALELGLSGEIIVGVGVGGVYKSIDHGDNWTKLDNWAINSGIYDIVVNSSGDIFVGTGNNVFRSTDNGANWVQIVAYPIEDAVYALAINSSDHIFAWTAGGSGSICRSTDNGDNWTKVSDSFGGVSLKSLYIDDNDVIYVGSIGQIFRSSDDGDTWTSLAFEPHYVTHIAVNTAGDLFAGTGTNGLFRSMDDGVSWTYLAFSEYSDEEIISLTIIPNGDIYTTTLTGNYRSSDNGDTWEQRPSEGYTLDMLALPDGTLIIGHPYGVYRSLDNGDSWTEVNNGIVKTGIQPVFASSSDKIFARTQMIGSVYSSYDGAVWDKVTLPTSSYVRNCFACNSMGHIFAAQNGLIVSTDNGITWAPVEGNMSPTDIAAIAISPSDDIFVTTQGGPVWRSKDNGSTWEVLVEYVDLDSDPPLVIGPDGLIYVGGMTDGMEVNIYRSDDNGDTWTNLNNGFMANRLAINSSGDIFAYAGYPSNHGLYRSTNNGESWTLLGFEEYNDNVRVLTIGACGDIYLSLASSGVYVSSDNGDTWTPINDGLANIDVISMAVNSSGDVFAGTANNGVFRLEGGIQSEQPQICLNPGFLHFEAISGGQLPEAKSITLSNPGTGILDWSIYKNVPWLHVSPTSGNSNNEEISISITSTDLDTGTYHGIVTINSTNGDGASRDIHVTYSLPRKFGTTIITHGYQFDVGTDGGLEEHAGWTLTMAKAIVERLGSGEVFTIVHGSINNYPIDGDYSPNGEKVIVFDWIDESDHLAFGLAEAAADVLFANLIEGALNGLWSLEQLHFIGHSRGAVVNSEVIQRLGYFDGEELLSVPVDNNIHMTTLDPHPEDNDDGDCISNPFNAADNDVNLGIPWLESESIVGRGIVCWDNVKYADNYRQGECHWVLDPEPFYILNGLKQFPGMVSSELETAKSLDLSNVLLGSTYEGAISTGAHSAVHAWYHGTIDTDCSANNTDVCNDGNGIYYNTFSWYNNIGILDRNLIGYGASYIFNNPYTENFTVAEDYPIFPDRNMNMYQIFNGLFLMHEGGNEDLPGWTTYQGGGGNAHVDDGHLEFDQSNESRIHDKFYVPETASHIYFEYRVPNNDWVLFGNQTDSFNIYINDSKMKTITLGEYQKTWKNQQIEVSTYQGQTITLKYEMYDYDGNGIDSEIWIANVHFLIDNYSPMMQLHMASPIDIEIISPTGKFLSRDSTGIEFATYDRYELEPGDTGATITIPNREVGTYQINVIPHPGTAPDAEYSVYTISGGEEIFFADHELIENIPEEGYQYYSAPEYICGDANSDEQVNIGDAVFIINYIFRGGAAPDPLEAGDANCDGQTNIGDAVYLINYIFRGGSEPCFDCP